MRVAAHILLVLLLITQPVMAQIHGGDAGHHGAEQSHCDDCDGACCDEPEPRECSDSSCFVAACTVAAPAILAPELLAGSRPEAMSRFALDSGSPPEGCIPLLLRPPITA